MLSSALFWKEVRDARWKLLVGLIISAATGISLPLLFGYLSGLVEQTPMPGWLRSAAELQVARYPFYLWANWYGKNMAQYALVLAAILGASTLAGERAQGSAEFVLTRPLSRRTIFLTKVGAGAAVLVTVIVPSSLITLVATGLAGRPVSPAWFLAGLPAFLAGSLALHALALFFSARMGDALKAGVAAVVAGLALGIPAYFPDGARFSLFYHMASGVAFFRAEVPVGGAWGSVLVLGAAALALYWAALVRFQRADF